MNGELSSNLVYPIPSVPASNYMRILFIGIVIENYCRQKLLNPLWILGLPLIMLGEHHTLNEVFLWQWTNQTFWCHYMPSSFVIQKISKPTQDIECVILQLIPPSCTSARSVTLQGNTLGLHYTFQKCWCKQKFCKFH